MAWIIENWTLLVAAGAVIAVVIIAVIAFCKYPTPEKLKKINEWLLWAVTDAEKDLGSGTGMIKLRKVYDMFIGRFPWVATFVSFEWFSKKVDEALVKMRELLKKNQAVAMLMTGSADKA